MDVLVEQQPDGLWLRLTGELDLSSADSFRVAGLGALDEPGVERVLLDMSGVEFMDSTGIGVLVDLRNAAQSRHRRLVIVEPSDRVREVLRLTAMDSVFEITPPHEPSDRADVGAS